MLLNLAPAVGAKFLGGPGLGLRARDNCAGEWLAEREKGWKFCGGFDTKINEGLT